MQLKIYGEQAKQINEGDTFIAKIGDVEGRTVVTLENIESLDIIDKIRKVFDDYGEYESYPEDVQKICGSIEYILNEPHFVKEIDNEH